MRKFTILITVFIIIWPAFTGKASIEPYGPFKYSGDGVITIFNTHSHEFETIKYKDGEKYIGDGVNELNRILRCRLTEKETQLSLRLIELVDHLEDHFGVHRVEVISAFRSPELNATLRKKNKRVARNSLHMKGFAMDIKLPGIPLKQVRDYARSLKAGGVGYYPKRFVHVDVGPVRHW